MFMVNGTNFISQNPDYSSCEGFYDYHAISVAYTVYFNKKERLSVPEKTLNISQDSKEGKAMNEKLPKLRKREIFARLISKVQLSLTIGQALKIIKISPIVNLVNTALVLGLNTNQVFAAPKASDIFREQIVERLKNGTETAVVFQETIKKILPSVPNDYIRIIVEEAIKANSLNSYKLSENLDANFISKLNRYKDAWQSIYETAQRIRYSRGILETMQVAKAPIYNTPRYFSKLNVWENCYRSLRFFAIGYSGYLIGKYAYTQIQQIRKLSTTKERIKATFDSLRKIFFWFLLYRLLRFLFEVTLVYLSAYGSIMIDSYLKLKFQELRNPVYLKVPSLDKNFPRIFRLILSPIKLLIAIELLLEAAIVYIGTNCVYLSTSIPAYLSEYFSWMYAHPYEVDFEYGRIPKWLNLLERLRVISLLNKLKHLFYYSESLGNCLNFSPQEFFKNVDLTGLFTGIEAIRRDLYFVSQKMVQMDLSTLSLSTILGYLRLRHLSLVLYLIRRSFAIILGHTDLKLPGSVEDFMKPNTFFDPSAQ